jgi:hypothetical protein
VTITGTYPATRFFSLAVYDDAPVATALADHLFDSQIAPDRVSLTLSVMIVPSYDLASVRPTRCGASKPFSPITRRTRRGLARTPAKRSRAQRI